jgi:hypothetical protein
MGQIDRIVVVGVGPVGFGEDTCDILRALLPGRANDVRGRLVVELLNALAEVGLGDGYAAVLEIAACRILR